MRVEQALQRLEAYHAQVYDIIATARAALRLGDASELKALGLERWKLLRALRELQLFKHTEIFDPVATAGCAARADMARVLKARCLELGSAYQEHVRRWTLDNSLLAWTDYQREALTMVDRIERHLAAELPEVRGLLRGAHRTRRP